MKHLIPTIFCMRDSVRMSHTLVFSNVCHTNQKSPMYNTQPSFLQSMSHSMILFNHMLCVSTPTLSLYTSVPWSHPTFSTYLGLARDLLVSFFIQMSHADQELIILLKFLLSTHRYFSFFFFLEEYFFESFSLLTR